MILILISLSTLPVTQGLTGENFADWHKALVPSEREQAWTGLAWRPSLWDAAIEANRTDRPILLWSMHGHPLSET